MSVASCAMERLLEPDLRILGLLVPFGRPHMTPVRPCVPRLKPVGHARARIRASLSCPQERRRWRCHLMSGPVLGRQPERSISLASRTVQDPEQRRSLLFPWARADHLQWAGRPLLDRIPCASLVSYHHPTPNGFELPATRESTRAGGCPRGGSDLLSFSRRPDRRPAHPCAFARQPSRLPGPQARAGSELLASHRLVAQ
jgi:hypothetical protein